MSSQTPTVGFEPTRAMTVRTALSLDSPPSVGGPLAESGDDVVTASIQSSWLTTSPPAGSMRLAPDNSMRLDERPFGASGNFLVER